MNPAQKRELYEWQSTKEGQSLVAKQRAASGVTFGRSQNAKKKLQAKVKALEAKVQGFEEGESLNPTLAKLESVIASAVNARSTVPPPAPPRAPVTSSVASAAVQLQSILKNGNKKRRTDDSC